MASERAAAIIERSGMLLMVEQRSLGPTGRHDGALYLTLPGGAIDAGETAVEAVTREVDEEVSLQVRQAEWVTRVEHGDRATTIFRVEVEPGQPTTGYDPELTCDCPRIVGIRWIPDPTAAAWHDDDRARALLKVPIA